MPTQNLNNLKGRIAEQLIQDMFVNAGYNVFNYGLERVMPGIGNFLKDKKNTPTAKALRFMPDFVVQSRLNGDLFYLEVKFRANGYFDAEKLKGYPYEKAWFIIVSPEKIQCIYYKSLAAGKSINRDTNYSISRIKSFHISPQLVEEYEEYAKQVFGAFRK